MNDKALTAGQLVNIGTTGDVAVSLDHTIYNSYYPTYRSLWSFTREEDNIVVRNTDNDIVCDTIPVIEADNYYDIVSTIEDNARRFKDINLAEQCLVLERIDDTSVVLSIHLLKKKLTLENNKLRAISNDYLKKYPMIRNYIKYIYPQFTFDNSEPWSTFSAQSMSPPYGKLFYHDFNFLYPPIFTNKGAI